MNPKHFRTLSQIVFSIFFAMFPIACTNSTILPTNTPVSINTLVPTYTLAPTQTVPPTATFTPEPTLTNTPIPKFLLISPFSPDCTEPTLIRANGAYNGIVPNPYDSGMAPGGSGNNYQGHSDFQRPNGCKDTGVYSPVSGNLTWTFTQSGDPKAFITLEKCVQLTPDPNNPDGFNQELSKYTKNCRMITVQIAHLSKKRDEGKVNAGDKIGDLINPKGGYMNFAGVPMISYQIQIDNTVWSPDVFLWNGQQPACLEHCEMKLDNYYKP